MMGQVVHTQPVSTVNGTINAQVQMSGDMASGMYLLNVRSTAGSHVYHFVVQR
jgi:hypothetical protein